MGGFIYNPKRRTLLSKRQVFTALHKINVKLYSNHMTHFKDVCIKISMNALIEKYKKEDPVQVKKSCGSNLDNKNDKDNKKMLKKLKKDKEA